MGYVPPPAPVRLNLDRFGMPRDYATYVWLLYRRRVADGSPARRAFLHGPLGKVDVPNYGHTEVR
jgi:hypothetical protein